MSDANQRTDRGDNPADSHNVASATQPSTQPASAPARVHEVHFTRWLAPDNSVILVPTPSYSSAQDTSPSPENNARSTGATPYTGEGPRVSHPAGSANPPAAAAEPGRRDAYIEYVASAEQRYHAFSQQPMSQAQKLFLAFMGFSWHSRDTLVCSKCKKLSNLYVAGYEVEAPGSQPLHNMVCPIGHIKDKCVSCGAFVGSRENQVAHAISAHVAPLLDLCGNTYELQQLMLVGKPPSRVQPKPQARLSQTAALPVVSIPPSDHVLVTASYRSASRSLAVECVTEPDAGGELPVLTGLQMFTRVTSADGHTPKPQAQPDGETAASDQEPQYNTTMTAWMTRSEYSALSMWVGAFKGVWK